MKKIRHHSTKGSALMAVSFLVLLLMVAGVSFLSRSTNMLAIIGIQVDSIDAQYQMETAYAQASAKVVRAVDNLNLNGRLRYFNTGNATWVVASGENYNNIANVYGTNTTTALDFLKDMVEAQAMNGSGQVNSAHEFASFTTAFPTTFTDPNPNDSNYYEVLYAFTPVAPDTSVTGELKFNYEYRVKVRGYGKAKFNAVTSEQAGIITIPVQGAPFSQYALFRHTTKNQNGSSLVFAGGDTSAQMQEVFLGKVHVNDTPYFYGHPTFNDLFTSTVATGSWSQTSASGYSCCKNLTGGSQGGVTAIAMPTDIFNTKRLAAGDPSNTAASNTSDPSNSDMVSYLQNHATGSLGSVSSVPAGTYVPVSSSGGTNPSGGIYVEGDANVTMNVVQGSSDFSSGQWAGIQAGHQSCKFQKISVDHATSGVATRDIYIADDPCDATYIYDAGSSGSAPVILNSRINGNVYVNGKIDQIGGASRTRPAVAQDFGITVSALKDIRVINDLQYEDAEYVSIASDGTMGTTVVADPYGAVDGSGILPTNGSIAPQISDDSQTVLGLISTRKNVLIHSSSPADLNIHAAIYAGYSAAYSSGSGTGCGSSGASTQGCGFGNEGWNTRTGLGSFKFLGSISEYKSQSMGVLSSPPTGYQRRLIYDTRLSQDVTPPAFPISSVMQVYPTVQPFKTWRLSKASP